MAILPGLRVGPYEILSPIGSGGMGEVWKARDTRLHRTVAVKFVKGNFGERFAREARTIAALNHPGICTVHDVGANYLVMEYIEGIPLKGPLPLEQALRTGMQISEALDAAHRIGIVHRDLKPANMLITKSGVKLLDFGLAKLLGAVAAGAETTTMAVTRAGEILGTLHYMSPEQVQGHEVDARSDIFSFGLVLYEAITGRRAFDADNPANLIAAILKEQPEPIERAAPATPPSLGRLIARALEKNPERRWQSVRDMGLELESILNSPEEPRLRINTAQSGTGVLWRIGVLVLVVAATAGALLFRWRMDLPDGTVAKTSIVPFAFEPESERMPIFSPDGKSVVYARDVRGTYQLFVRSLGTQSPVQISECSKGCFPTAWSGDSARVYYTSGDDLFLMAASGGTARLVMKGVGRVMIARAAAVTPDGKTLLFARQQSGGSPELVTSSPPGAEPKMLAKVPAPIFELTLSPDARKIAASTSGDEIAIVSFPEGKLLTVIHTGDTAVYADWLPDSRHLVYSRARASSKEVVFRDTETSASRIILRSEESILETSVSAVSMRMAYASGVLAIGINDLSLDSGSVKPLRMTRVTEYNADYAPAGDQIVYAGYASGRSEIMVRELAGDHATQLTFDNPVSSSNALLTRNYPRFSPDGRRILFSQSKQIWTMSATGGQPVAVTPVNEDAGAPSWSPDGRWIAYVRTLDRGGELVKIDSDGQGQPVTLCNQALAQSVGWFTRWSASGEIAYSSPSGVRVCGEKENGAGRLLVAGSSVGDFNRQGNVFYALKRDNEEWKLLTVDVSTGGILKTRVVEESPRATMRAASMHPNGKHLAYTRSEANYDLWLMDGLPQPATGWQKLFRHWIEP